MFHRQTAFILGAGASLQYGYPTGRQLIENIISVIRNEWIFIPSEGYTANTLDFDHISFENLFTELTSEELFQINFRHLEEGIQKYQIGLDKNFCKFKRHKLSEIPTFESLMKGLIEFDPVSIDKFLHDHQQHQNVGKLLITYCILMSETETYFNKGKTALYSTTNHEDTAKACDNWYRLLLNEITSSCTIAGEINNNKLDIITFNYDVSLDYYIHEKLKKTTFFSENDEVLEEFFNNNAPIRKDSHVYGRIHDIIKNPNSTKYTGYGYADTLNKNFPADRTSKWSKNPGRKPDDKEREALRNLITFIQASRLKDNIEVIGEDKANDQRNDLVDIIKQSTSVYIIGFGFDLTNQKLLKLKQSLKRQKDGSSRLHIYLHDYKGIHQNIIRSLLSLSQETKFRADPDTSATTQSSVSTSEKIEDALVDFMTPLID